MSILPISGPIQLALSMFTLSGVPVIDTEYNKVGGIDKQTILANRTIDAAIDPASMQQLQKIFGGNVSDGDLAIYTEDELFIFDIYPTTGSRKQSFIIYSGLNYRIMDHANWIDQAGVRVYQGRRHVKQDVV